MFRQWGADVVNMTSVPEVVLAKEAGLCYASIAMATDYDCWKEHEEAVSVCVCVYSVCVYSVCVCVRQTMSGHIRSAWIGVHPVAPQPFSFPCHNRPQRAHEHMLNSRDRHMLRH